MSKKMIISAVVAGVVLLGGGGLFGWQFPLWLLGIVAFLVLGWSLMVRYKPRQVGSFVHFLVKRIPKGEKGKVFSENHQSGDWPEWFAKQNAEGWQLPECQLKTRWSKDINPRAPLPEYPRPQLTRDRWVNLNGLWSFNVVPEATVSVTEFPGKILVPYAIESALSGVQRPLFAGENLWYQRTFSVPSDWDGEERIVLHFGAVDWQTTVLVNGVEQGVHQGGYTPFSFDITDAVNRNKENQLTVIVWDPTNSDGSSQQRGKQALVPQFISYTASSGIWQTVWMEPVAERHIDRIVTTANIAKGTALLDVQTIGDCDGLTVEVTLAGERQKFTAGVGQPVLVKPDEIRLWTPETPNLYDISVRLLDGDKVVDETDSYFALREVGTVRQGDSTLLTLNGKPVFHNGPLDQGYWPDGIYTAATDEALKYDIELAKSYGFNMLRKHIKVEPARWYYHADKLGIMVWQDMISGGFTVPPRDGWVDYLQHVAPLGVKHQAILDNDYAGWGRTEENKTQFRAEFTELVNSLQAFPSVVVWIPFNEYWGQFDTNRMTELCKVLDPTRLVNPASGFYDQGGGDIYDMHIYMQKIEKVEDPRRFRASVLGEYGGKTWAVEGHMWSDKTFGYGKTQNQADYQKAYSDLMQQEIKVAISHGLAGAVYTQLTDVEIEINGMVTYDREVSKIAPQDLTALHNELYAAFDKRNG